MYTVRRYVFEVGDTSSGKSRLSFKSDEYLFNEFATLIQSVDQRNVFIFQTY